MARTFRRPAGAVALLLCLLLVPGAAAERATLVLDSPREIALRGEVEARAPGGVVRVDDAFAVGEYVLEGASGRLSLQTWRTASVLASPQRFQPPVESARNDTFRLDGATVRIALRGEPAALTAVTAGGSVSVSGRVEGAGAPVALRSRVEGIVDGRGPPVWPFRLPENVPWSWERGWRFVGDFPPHATGAFPAWTRPVIGLEGGVLLQARGGNVTFVDEHGRERAFQLGNWTEEEAAANGVVEVQVQRRLIFEGAVARASIPPGGAWGVAAPAMAWRVDGAAEWTDASGWADGPRGREAFRDARVRAEGVFTLTPDLVPEVATGSTPARYAGGGDFAVLDLGGVRVVSDAPGDGLARTAAGLSAAALLLGLAEWARHGGARVLAAGYTRFAPEDLLAHPRRQRILEIVAARPGIHLHELRRALESAWGAFAFHYAVLREAGYLRAERLGRYTLVYPSGAQRPGGAVAIPSPVARRIYDALPADGTPVPVKDVEGRAGVSRQLLRYHLRCLEARGHVQVVREGERLAARRAA